MNEKVKVLTALARLEDDESSQLQLISSDTLNMFLMDIANHHVSSLNLYSKLRLFNMLRQSEANEPSLKNLNLLSEENIKYLQNTYR